MLGHGASADGQRVRALTALPSRVPAGQHPPVVEVVLDLDDADAARVMLVADADDAPHAAVVVLDATSGLRWRASRIDGVIWAWPQRPAL